MIWQAGQASSEVARLMAFTRGFAIKFFKDTEVTDHSLRSALHMGHSEAESETEVLQREQICMGHLSKNQVWNWYWDNFTTKVPNCTKRRIKRRFE